MPLIKTADGLLEEENFFITSPAADFLGDGEWSRTDNKFILKSGCIKRRLSYENFVIDVDKAESSPGGSFEFFIEDRNGSIGIHEGPEGAKAKSWRLIYYDGFIQTYATVDGVIWENTGGCEVSLSGEIMQGFRVAGEAELVLTGYRVYASPYLTLQNFAPQSLAKLYNEKGDIIAQRFFDENHECGVFLSHQVSGRAEVWDGENLLYKSASMAFKQGDVFLFTNENILLIYKERVLDYRTTELNSMEEAFIIKNAGNEDALNITVEVVNKNGDLITMSLDKQKYEQKLCIGKLEAGEEKDVFLRIAKDARTGQFCVKRFDIHIY